MSADPLARPLTFDELYGSTAVAVDDALDEGPPDLNGRVVPNEEPPPPPPPTEPPADLADGPRTNGHGSQRASTTPDVSVRESFAARVLSTSRLCALPPQRFLIDGLVPDDAVTLLYGPSGAGKSFVAIDMAMHIATGTWWQGREVRGGKVLYVIAESAAGVGPRVEAWQEHHRLDVDDFHGVAWIPEPVNLFDPSSAGLLRGWVEDNKPACVFIDTLARCAVGAEENSAKDMGRVIEQVDLLRRPCGSAVMLVHHAGKNVEHGARGSSALRAAVDAELEVTGDDSRITLRTTKQKNAPEALPIRLELRQVATSCVVLKARADSLTGELSAGAQSTLESLRRIEVPGGIPTTAWCKASQQADRTFYDHRKRLLDAGLVRNIGTEKAPRYVVCQDEQVEEVRDAG